MAASTQRIAETWFCEGHTVNRESGVIENVRILGAKSKNGRHYTDQALHDGARLYEGMRCNFDHPPKDQPRAERSFSDFAGQLRQCRVDTTLREVRGNFHIATKHRDAELLLEAAEKFSNTFGLSHNADGDVRMKNDTQIVESLTHVESVDIVTRPATNEGLFESEEHTMSSVNQRKSAKTKTVRQIIEDSPAKTSHRQLLLEIENEGIIADEAPIEVEEDASPEDQIKSGIMAAIWKKLETASGEEMEAVLEVLGLKDTVDQAINGGGETEAAAEDTDTATEAATESVNSKLLNKINKLEAKNMLLEADIEATDIRIAAIAAVPESARKTLLDSWNVAGRNRLQNRGHKPRTSAPIRESDSSSSSEWNDRLQRAKDKLNR